MDCIAYWLFLVVLGLDFFRASELCRQTHVEKQNFKRVFKDYDYALELDYYFFASDDIVEIAQIVTSLFQDVYQCGGNLEFKPETTK